MGEVIHVDENGKVKKKIDVKQIWNDTKEKACQVWEKCKENKEAVIAVTSVAVPGIIEIAKMIIKGAEKKEDNDRRKKAMWDPVEGHWWYLRRPLTNNEYLEVEHRVRNGEARGEVLYEMGVLRKR